MLNKLPAPYVQKVILSHQVTEKASRVLEKNQYVFKVHLLSDKLSVKQSIEKQFGVKVTAVNILTMPGKSRRAGKTQGRRSDWKKAYITLKEGFSINLDANSKKD